MATEKEKSKEFIRRSTYIKKGKRNAVIQLDDAIERAVEKDRY